ncbi:hypothetical protein N9298_01355, partial [bacterium]|nr:hypothetical protein [bacterium]
THKTQKEKESDEEKGDQKESDEEKGHQKESQKERRPEEEVVIGLLAPTPANEDNDRPPAAWEIATLNRQTLRKSHGDPCATLGVTGRRFAKAVLA